MRNQEGKTESQKKYIGKFLSMTFFLTVRPFSYVIFRRFFRLLRLYVEKKYFCSIKSWWWWWWGGGGGWRAAETPCSPIVSTAGYSKNYIATKKQVNYNKLKTTAQLHTRISHTNCLLEL